MAKAIVVCSTVVFVFWNLLKVRESSRNQVVVAEFVREKSGASRSVLCKSLVNTSCLLTVKVGVLS